MKKFLLTVLLLAAPVAAQQATVRVAVPISVEAGTGFSNPIYGVEVGATTSSSKAVIDTEAHYLFARKTSGGGHNAGGRISLGMPVGKLLVGPALAFSRQTTSFYSKSAFSLGGEVKQIRRSHIESARFFQDLSSVNKARRYEGQLEWYGGKRGFGPYVSARAGFQDFRCIQGPIGLTKHCVSAHAYLSVGLYLTKRVVAE